MKTPDTMLALVARAHLLLADRWDRVRDNNDSGINTLEVVVLAAIIIPIAVLLANQLGNLINDRRALIK